MARDRAKDNKLFNCSQEHELNYVAGLYTEKKKVYDFLKEACNKNLIYDSKHDQVYQLIKGKLGYEKPF